MCLPWSGGEDASFIHDIETLQVFKRSHKNFSMEGFSNLMFSKAGIIAERQYNLCDNNYNFCSCL